MQNSVSPLILEEIKMQKNVFPISISKFSSQEASLLAIIVESLNCVMPQTVLAALMQ